MSWPKERRVELARLLELIRDAEQLNTANGTVQRMERLIVNSHQLTEHDLIGCRVSFVEFLKEEATK